MKAKDPGELNLARAAGELKVGVLGFLHRLPPLLGGLRGINHQEGKFRRCQTTKRSSHLTLLPHTFWPLDWRSSEHVAWVPSLTSEFTTKTLNLTLTQDTLQTTLPVVLLDSDMFYHHREEMRERVTLCRTPLSL